MSLNLNKVILGGRLTATPELKQTPNGVSVTTFTIAVNRKGRDGLTDFIDCQAWRQTAEFITKYFSKGNAICIVGSLQKRSWKDKNGENRYVTEVIADEAMFVESKGETPTFDVPADSKPIEPKFESLNADDPLPF